MKNILSNITGMTLLGVIGFLCLFAIVTKVLSTAGVMASEPVPPHVEEKANRITSRVESIEGIDIQMKPLKAQLATLQLSRNNLAADNNDDSKSLERWGYEFNWDSLTVRRVVDLGLGVTLP